MYWVLVMFTLGVNAPDEYMWPMPSQAVCEQTLREIDIPFGYQAECMELIGRDERVDDCLLDSYTDDDVVSNMETCIE